MMQRWLLVSLLLGCGASPAPPRTPAPPIAPNRGVDPALRSAWPPRPPAPQGQAHEHRRARAIAADKAAIEGKVTNPTTHVGVAGVTIIVISTAMAVSRTVITDDRGNYYVEVPVGSYKVTLFFGDLSYEINDVETEAGQVTGVDWVLDPNARRWLEPAQSAKTTLRPGISVEATSP